MGKKINPKIFRLKQNKTWDSRWFDLKNYARILRQDLEIKDYLKQKLLNAFVSQISIERTAKEIVVTVASARPGVIIGRAGSGIEDLKKEIKNKFFRQDKTKLNVNIKEVNNPNADAMLLSLAIKFDLEKRIPFRRAMKQAMAKAEKAGVRGVKVEVSGRLNGAEIARTEKLLFGKLPLHTLRADIDYAFTEALTIYGKIGIKVWVYRGDVFVKKQEAKI